ncbi:flagellar basal body-associated protein FliL [Aquibacillus koreensis]|uniref:Flagellar protein FliL n=1 Tax=Aquibacillus koreensis TaxID=279446 RepID=A0A9X3WQP1_9BACI|nr:flagellar basal body-associated FliL family protein [Aquibacillus koreensis]MCT2534530.1 flagellar basal body-associated protein FliL [Aquibacillus koreensis]MDC3421876.1 flagellar basal body-associated protein FliL [Aquibacillus koreensis]
MNPKLLKAMVIVLIIITILGIVALVYVLNMPKDGEAKEPKDLSIDEMIEYSVTTAEMQTDLADGSFVQIQFQIVADSKKGKEEITKREFQVKNLFIKESVELTEKDFKTGISELENKMKTGINGLMEEGNITDVYIISKIIQ